MIYQDIKPNWSTVIYRYRNEFGKWQVLKVTGGRSIGKRTLRSYWHTQRRLRREAIR